MSISWRFTLFLIAATVWLALVFYPDKNLKLIACDVGQGDAILAIYGKTQILIDAGPNNKVLECLSRYLPFWDREIEVVVNSHPQKDHYMGLIDVLKTYKVDSFVATSLDSGSQEWQVLKDLVGSKGIKVINPRSGQKLRIGLIYLDIVWPIGEFLAVNLGKNDKLTNLPAEASAQAGQLINQSSNVLGAYTSKKDSNEFSVVAILSFKDFDALLTGDISTDISNKIAEQLSLSDSRTIDYLKVPHHGSKNGLTVELLEASSPEIAVISSGKNNSYGHPHQEVIKLLSDQEIKILRTDELGDIIVESDGEKIWLRK